VKHKDTYNLFGGVVFTQYIQNATDKELQKR